MPQVDFSQGFATSSRQLYSGGDSNTGAGASDASPRDELLWVQQN